MFDKFQIAIALLVVWHTKTKISELRNAAFHLRTAATNSPNMMKLDLEAELAERSASFLEKYLVDVTDGLREHGIEIDESKL